MAHIKRIDLTRDVEAHADAYREAIEKVCRETAFSGGKYADTFDKEFAAYVGSRYASGVNNGTSALHLAMLALGVAPGDEVMQACARSQTVTVCSWWRIAHRPMGHSLRGKMWEPWETWHASASIRAKISILSEKAEVSPVRRKSTISILTA